MNDRTIGRILFFAVLTIGIMLVPSIGPAWDEPDNIVAGGQYASFFQKKLDGNILTRTDQDASTFGHTIYSQKPDMARYPPIPNYVGTIVAALSGAKTSQQIIVAFHIATVLFFALLVTYVYLFGRFLGLSQFSSLFAAAVTFLYPTLFGHGLSNLKDTASVSLCTITLYYLAKKHISTGGILWGLALATKFNAVYIPIIWTVWNITAKNTLRVTGYRLLITVAVGIATAFAVWPYLWFDPIARAWEIVHYFTTVGQGYKIFWNDALYTVGVGKILWWYPWANLLFVTTLPLLFLWVIGIGHVIKHPASRILLIWFTIPLLRSFFPHAAFYDGVRHFLEILPAGILIATIGLAQLVKFVKLDTFGKSVLAGSILLHLVWINAAYFPYSTGYYNMLAPNPNKRFDRDIEALSIKEGVDYLYKKFGSITLWSPIGGHLAWYYIHPQDRYVYSMQEADSIILVNKSSHIRQKEFHELVAADFVLDHVISRKDAVFAWIYRRK